MRPRNKKFGEFGKSLPRSKFPEFRISKRLNRPDYFATNE